MINQSLFDALKTLLISRKANTQEDLCEALNQLGYEVNQTKISRLLRKMGAVKVLDSQGKIVYSLPREPSPPSLDTPLRELIVHIAANETMIVIFTSPGSASLVARLLDYQQTSIGILGTIAGDDTILIIPQSIKDIQTVTKKLKQLLTPSAD
jgi:transcriptional regulator of arginine metabolism